MAAQILIALSAAIGVDAPRSLIELPLQHGLARRSWKKLVEKCELDAVPNCPRMTPFSMSYAIG
ncbi:MAG TPA: hypothetical protein VF861_08780 [Telluria sp.]